MAATTQNPAEALTAALRESESSSDTPAETEDQSSASSEQSVEASEETQGSDRPKKNSNLQERFGELTGKLRAAQEEATAKDEALKDAQERLANIERLLVEKDEEAKVGRNAVATIQALQNAAAQDEEVRQMVEKLDRRIQGLEDDADELSQGSAEEKKEGAELQKQADDLKKYRTQIDQQLSQHREELADQKTDLIAAQARSVVERYFNDLPEEYTAQDKAELYRSLMEETDWDKIEESYDRNPAILQEAIGTTLQGVIQNYGNPRGAYMREVQDLQEQIKKFEQHVPKERVQQPDEVAKKIMDVEWSAINKDGKKAKPKYSDDVFSQGLAELLRQSRRST